MENSHSPVHGDYHDDQPNITTQDCTEESGWTAYFQDFSNNNNNDDGDDVEESKADLFSCDHSICTSSSLVSDAASYAAWKIKTPIHNNNNNNYSFNKTPKKLTFKKTRANQVISEDDSLEDTASSPVNSPKVSDMIKAKVQTDDLNYDSAGKRGTSQYYSELIPKERSLVDFDGKNECIDLKKRGLCLVPLSMLMNYHG